MSQDVFSQSLTVLKDVKVPLFKLVADLQNVCPLPLLNIDQLSEALLVLLDLILVGFTIFTMQLF